MAYKPVGADENGKFPPRVEAALSATYGPAAQASSEPLKSAFAAGVNADKYAQFGAPQHEDGTVYVHPTLLDFGASEVPPMAKAAPSKGVDIVAHWYNDFGLTSTALANGAKGWTGWYDWQWNFPTKGNYDPSRHPIQGFYKGDDPNVLGWQCYWMAEAGVTAVAITESGGFSRTDWENPAAGQHWVYQLMNNTPNFKSLKYTLSLKSGGTAVAIEAQNDDLVATYAAYPGAYTYIENGKTYAVVTAWEFEQLRGVYDNFSGSTNTIAYLKALATKFKNIGYDGVMILARNSGLVAFEQNTTLKPAGVMVMAAEYETRYGTDASYGNSYTNYANNVVFPTEKHKVLGVVTSAKTQLPHTSGWALDGSTPAAFRTVLQKAVDAVIKNKQRRIVTVYNVSEWAEGGPGLIPNKRDRFGYLDAIKAVSTQPRQAVDPDQLTLDGMKNRKDWSVWKKTGITAAVGRTTVDVSGATTLYSSADSMTNYAFLATVSYTGAVPDLPISAMVMPSFADTRLYVKLYNPNTIEHTGITVSLEVRRLYP